MIGSAAPGGPVEIAVIGDTHLPRGRRRLPEACVARLRSADLAIHVGDFSTMAVYEEIASLCRGPLIAVHGNVDEPELRRRLPERTELEACGSRIAVVHDAGPARNRVARLRAQFPAADAVVFGHSHLPLHERDGDFQIFNPGSPTQRRRAPAHTIGMAKVADGEPPRFRHIRLS